MKKCSKKAKKQTSQLKKSKIDPTPQQPNFSPRLAWRITAPNSGGVQFNEDDISVEEEKEKKYQTRSQTRRKIAENK
jgi:hypothetical protein